MRREVRAMASLLSPRSKAAMGVREGVLGQGLEMGMGGGDLQRGEDEGGEAGEAGERIRQLERDLEQMQHQAEVDGARMAEAVEWEACRAENAELRHVVARLQALGTTKQLGALGESLRRSEAEIVGLQRALEQAQQRAAALGECSEGRERVATEDVPEEGAGESTDDESARRAREGLQANMGARDVTGGGGNEGMGEGTGPREAGAVHEEGQGERLAIGGGGRGPRGR